MRTVARDSGRVYPACLAVWYTGLLLLAGCATHPSGPSSTTGPLRTAETRLAEARTPARPVKSRITDYFNAAEIAGRELRNPANTEPAKQEAQQVYDAASAEAVVLLNRAEGGKFWNRNERLSGPDDASYALRFQRGGHDGVWSPAFFDEFKLPTKADVRGLRPWVHGGGVGGPLIGIRKADGVREPREPFAPKVGYACPVTATLDFFSADQTSTPAGAREVSVTLYDPTVRSSASVAGATRPLAYDLTAPLGHYPRNNASLIALGGFLRADRVTYRSGLYLAEPYDPKRIPLVFVHGLFSTHHMWLNLMNEIRADPQLRARYQFWIFYYPTANPVAYSALVFRQDLARAERLYRPKQGMVLIGHSMGGLVCRMQSVDTGRVLWDQVFGQNADRLYAKVPDANLLKESLVFHRDPEVKRIIFVCVPHRGSTLALSSIGMFGARLIRVPAKVTGVLKNTLGNSLEAATGVKGQRLPTSIQGLSPRSPVLIGLDKLPIQAPHHSIIGDRGRGDTPNSSDGVVPYWSSHLDSAQSEQIVPASHTAYRNAEAVDEVLRILRLHLSRKGQAAQPKVVSR